MTMTPDTVYLDGLDFFGAVVARLAPDDWARRSPCAGWRALDVLGHVGAACAFGTRLLTTGEMVWEETDSPGSTVEGDPAAWWEALAPTAGAAVAGVDLDRVIETPMGSRTVAEGLAFPAIDLFVHAWDLAATIGESVVLPDEAIEFAEATFAGLPADMMRSPAIFGEALDAPPGATRSEAFLAWTGRDPRWHPGA